MAEILNAKIESTMLGHEDHGIFSASLFLKLEHYSIGFGGYALDEWDKTLEKRIDKCGYAGEFIKEILDTVGVDSWEKLKGQLIRVRTNEGGGLSTRIDAIGHIMEDKWFSPEIFFKEFMARNETATNEQYEHVNSFGVTYYLRKATVTLRDNKEQDIFFFTKEKKHAKGEPSTLPAGYRVRENPRNGFLTVGRYESETPEDDD